MHESSPSMSMSGRDYNSDQKKVDGGWAMMMSFMRVGGGQSVQVCVVGSSEDRGGSPDSQENRCDNMLCIIQKPEGGEREGKHMVRRVLSHTFGWITSLRM